MVREKLGWQSLDDENTDKPRSETAYETRKAWLEEYPKLPKLENLKLVGEHCETVMDKESIQKIYAEVDEQIQQWKIEKEEILERKRKNQESRESEKLQRLQLLNEMGAAEV